MIQKNLLIITFAITLISIVIICGCSVTMPEKAEINPLRFYRYPNANMSKIGRVVILELDNESANQNLGSDITIALAEEIQKKQIFGLDTLTKSNPKWRSIDIDQDKPITAEQLLDIHSKFNADAVLFGQVTHYRPYPRNSIGLKLKLLDCQTGQMLWAIDQVWDSTDVAIENRIQSFFNKQMRSGYEPMEWEITMLSPRIYNKYVAYEIARTLE